MTITASQVNELRQKTGAGMMDCKRALTEANGDYEKAIDILRKKGAAVAAKRAEKSANEGLVLIKISDDKKTGVIAEVNCETDFVAKSDDFINFADSVLQTVFSQKPVNKEDLLANNPTLNNQLNDVMGKVGEKIEISRFAVDEAPDGPARRVDAPGAVSRRRRPCVGERPGGSISLGGRDAGRGRIEHRSDQREVREAAGRADDSERVRARPAGAAGVVNRLNLIC